MCLVLLLFLSRWDTDLRRHWYDWCHRMFCLCFLPGVLQYLIFKSLSHFEFIFLCTVSGTVLTSLIYMRLSSWGRFFKCWCPDPKLMNQAAGGGVQLLHPKTLKWSRCAHKLEPGLVWRPHRMRMLRTLVLGARGVGGDPAQHSALHPPVLWGTGEARPRDGQERMSFSQMIVPLTASYRCGIRSVKNSLHLKIYIVQT